MSDNDCPHFANEWGISVTIRRDDEEMRLWFGNDIDEPPSQGSIKRLLDRSRSVIEGLWFLGWSIVMDSIAAQRMTGVGDGKYRWENGVKMVWFAKRALAGLETVIEQ